MNRGRFSYSLPIILLLIVAVAGWFATEYLGNKARQEIIGESRASALTLSVYVSATLNKFEEAVKSLAGSPWIAPALLSKGVRDIEQANSALDRYNSALSASVSYLMDADGMTVASSNRNDPDSFVGKSYRFRPYFQEAFRGNPYRYFALGITSGKRGFYASHSVQNHLGKVVGVVTMKKDIDEIETFFSKYTFCFLVSRDGIIFLSSTPAMDLKSLWPLDKTARGKLIASQQFGNKHFEAVIEKEIADGAEVTLEGNDYIVSRKVIDSDGWSIVLLTPIDRIRIYKLIGILATISVCFLIAVFSGVIYFIDRSKEAIRQSEKLYKTLAEKSLAGVYVTQDGKFRFINFNAASYAGYTREELLDQEAGLIVRPEDREKARQNARALLRGDESSPYEFRIITKEGETRWIMETVTSILHEGRPAILGNSMDITERKRAEEALREGEQRLHSIIDGSPIPAFVIGKDHRVIHWNKALEAMSSIKFEEVAGTCEHWRAFYSEERPCMADLLVDEAVELAPQLYSGKYIKSPLIEGAYESTEFFSALGENGKWLRFTAAAVRDSKGMIVAAIETLEDITERKSAEKRIDEALQFNQTILSASPVAILTYNSSGQCVSANEAASKITGGTIEELLAQNFRQLESWKRAGMIDAAENALKTRQVQVLETRIVTTFVKDRWFDCRFTPFYHEGELHLLVLVSDVTWRKQAEDTLRKSEEKYRALLNNIEDGCYEVDLPGNFTFVNPSMTRILGYSKEELIGMNNRQYLDKENAKRVFQAFNMVFKTGVPTRHFGWELIRKDGTKAFVGCSVSLIKDSSDNPIGFRGILHDITERKQMEEEIRSLSLTDPLTGLHNRRGFLTLAEQQLKIAARTKNGLLLLFADLDGMKWINDNLGHKKGDEALIEAANVLKQVFREADIVARVGGDEFSVLAVGITMEDSRIIEDRLHYQIGINNSRENRDYSLSMSIGIAYNDAENPSTIDELMSHADALMYEQKKGKRS